MTEKAKAAEVTREFVGGKMVVTLPNGKTIEVTQEQLQVRIDSADERIAAVTARKAELEDWLAQAQASA